MTSNQVAYWNLVELNRSNLAKEAENYRSNLAREMETHRSNLVSEVETERSHRANEAIGWSQASASHRQAAVAETNAQTNRMMAESNIALNQQKIFESQSVVTLNAQREAESRENQALLAEKAKTQRYATMQGQMDYLFGKETYDTRVENELRQTQLNLAKIQTELNHAELYDVQEDKLIAETWQAFVAIPSSLFGDG